MIAILKQSLACALLLGASAGGFAQTPAGPAAAPPLELHVMNSGGFTAAYKLLAPRYEAVSGQRLTIAYGPSMGATPEAIPNRLARGEPADVVIMVGYALDALIAQGRVDPASRVELADSRIGMVVRAGAPTPDIATPDALKATLLRAPSIAYSDSASGVYVRDVLFARLGIDAQVRGKAIMIPRIPVASKVADGTYALGLQQVSELLPVPGAHFVGKLPESLQSVTRFAGGVPVSARHPREARALLDYLASPEAAADVARTGLDPVPPR
ncbi:substrate-binding domain-containing protein [Burkholderia sp. FERM BP-3421]|jgi:molybdate transport system substrate-binding protein|uniref:substrate-binding domain-containing protein n=1 Tax=Burkholderia sp. FERM BP-3421 TaxID=1494466 RepID=UPI002360ECE7|nr:substrate-binding domain-containing protein [Burkholderia sp. FERM BP-3421]WDD96507.1 substrate-binding domain-containing protein [Burkholderia sp. FERM BP-3421]